MRMGELCEVKFTSPFFDDSYKIISHLKGNDVVIFTEYRAWSSLKYGKCARVLSRVRIGWIEYLTLRSLQEAV